MVTLTIETGKDFVEPGREALRGRATGLLTGRAEADDKVLSSCLTRPQPLEAGGQHDVATCVAGGAVDVVQPTVREVSKTVRGSHIADACGDEGAIRLKHKVGVALVGIECPRFLLLHTVNQWAPRGDGIAGVTDPRIGHMRLEQQIGVDVAPKGADRRAYDEGLAIGVGVDALFDLEAAAAVRGHHPIGRRKRPAPRIRVQIFDAAGRVAAFDEDLTVDHNGEPHLFDLGLVDQAVHGLGQDAVREREPDPGDVAGAATVTVLPVDIGFVGRACAGLGRAGPDGLVPGCARRDRSDLWGGDDHGRSRLAAGDQALQGRTSRTEQQGGTEGEAGDCTHGGARHSGGRRKVSGVSRR